ncbi:uncharacterized protein FA14DRAFT_19506 [Meira miltonrushii]|uniref:Uncharacterized protein n=1 Tax=Meira miltonrushii TaxID=1280837 RepID=A0A316VJL3_9BASI|nr:uncharacterized protein FA14DRAFT_19506 [Meira miltonrushii]PWN37812.1 hypothetical protein FA14DRAFT_19506 [Meira miltonrushii]
MAGPLFHLLMCLCFSSISPEPIARVGLSFLTLIYHLSSDLKLPLEQHHPLDIIDWNRGDTAEIHPQSILGL